MVLGFPDIYAAGDAVPRILAAKPIACEGLDEAIIGGLRERALRLDDIKLLPAGKAWLMVEFGADTKEEAVLRAAALGGGVITDKATDRPAVDHSRDRRLGHRAQPRRQGRRPGGRLGGRRGRSAAPGRLPARIPGARRPLSATAPRSYGHFGDGCIHARINFDLRTGAASALAPIPYRGRAPGGEVRRLAFRRARRRPGEGRAAADHVQRRS